VTASGATAPSKGRWIILLVVSMALFLVSVDITVLYTALPSMARDLNTTASQKIWIVNAYVLVVAGLLPGFGTLGDRVGHRRMFAIGLVVFGIASLAAGFSRTAELLIATRAVTAVGAAMMSPATLSLVTLTFDDERERAFAIGIWGAIASGGALLGPVIGGVMLEYFPWNAVFLVNVPIVVVVFLVGWMLIPRRPGNPAAGWDLSGSLQMMIGLVGMAYAIETLAQEEPPWLETAAAGLIGVVSLAIFVRRQRRSTRPMIDFALFADPDFTLAVIVGLVSSFSVVGLELVLSQRLQLLLGFSPLQAGFFVLPGAIMALLGGPLAGWLAPRLGNSRVMSMTLVAGGLGSLGMVFTAHAALWPQIVSLSLFGLSEGAAVAVAANAIMGYASAEKAGMAASIEEFSFELGGAIGIAVLAALQAGVYSAFLVLPNIALPPSVHVSIDQALEVVHLLRPEDGQLLHNAVDHAFDQAYYVTMYVQAAILLAFAVRAVFARRSAAASGAAPH
jgi:DHA2 family multidrug resistance protein-like MFS transporter